ncbi:DEAD/DEAH box helicase, partial [Vibrio sp. 404]|nr:DEAD/DEAH box helicase [Vibrio marinisediminis]
DLLDRKALRLSETRFLVLDEADQMLDLGFIHALRKIAPLLPAERQTMLFSATMPKQMEELSRAYLTDPVRVEVA